MSPVLLVTAVVTCVIAVLGFGVTLVIHIIKAAEDKGHTRARLEQAETDISTLKEGERRQDSKTELAVLTALLSAMKDQIGDLQQSFGRRMDQMEHDLRNLLTGKVQPASRTRRQP